VQVVLDMHPEYANLVLDEFAALDCPMPSEVARYVASKQKSLDDQHEADLEQLTAEDIAQASKVPESRAAVPEYIQRRRQELEDGALPIAKPRRRQASTTNSRYMVINKRAEETPEQPSTKMRALAHRTDRPPLPDIPTYDSQLPQSKWLKRASLKAQQLDVETFLAGNSVLQTEAKINSTFGQMFQVRHPSRRRSKQPLTWLVMARPAEFQQHQRRLAELLEVFEKRRDFLQSDGSSIQEHELHEHVRQLSSIAKALATSRDLGDAMAAAVQSADEGSAGSLAVKKPRWNEGARSTRRQRGLDAPTSERHQQPGEMAPKTTRAHELRSLASEFRRQDGVGTREADIMVLPSSEDDEGDEGADDDLAELENNPSIDFERAPLSNLSSPSRSKSGDVEGLMTSCIDVGSDNAGLSRHATVRRVACLLAEVTKLEREQVEQAAAKRQEQPPAEVEVKRLAIAPRPTTTGSNALAVLDLMCYMAWDAGPTFSKAPRNTTDHHRSVCGLLRPVLPSLNLHGVGNRIVGSFQGWD
jgi:hypothetical protein